VRSGCDVGHKPRRGLRENGVADRLVSSRPLVYNARAGTLELHGHRRQNQHKSSLGRTEASAYPCDLLFGSDNARFSTAFVGGGAGVCVLRPGYEAEFEEAAADTVVRKSGRVVFVHDKKSCTSSTYVRQKRPEAPPQVLKQDKPHTLALDLPAEDVDRKTQSELAVNFYLRQEGCWAALHWTQHRSEAEGARLVEMYGVFYSELCEVFERYLNKGTSAATTAVRVHIKSLDLQDQATSFQRPPGETAVLSLDPCLPGAAYLRISRCFEPVTGRFLRWTFGPGAEPLE
jgi:hypothetical protein